MKEVRNKVFLKNVLFKLSGTDQQTPWLEQLFHQEQAQELWMAYKERTTPTINEVPSERFQKQGEGKGRIW